MRNDPCPNSLTIQTRYGDAISYQCEKQLGHGHAHICGCVTWPSSTGGRGAAASETVPAPSEGET